MNGDLWNRCDVCGKFIPLAEFAEGGSATRKMLEPDSEFGGEKFETLCFEHDFADPYEQEHDRLRALLPHTEDGVPIVPGMHLYWPSRAEWTSREGVRVESVVLYEDYWSAEGVDAPTVPDTVYIPADFRLFSTSAAALAARGEGDR